MSSKTCSKCGETKPLTAFSAHLRGKDGVRGDCKACVDARRKAKALREPVILTEKRCSDCRQIKKVDQFGYSSRSRDQRQGRCRECLSAYQRRRRLWQNYDLTPEQYEQLGSSCSVCGGSTRLAVDHCHSSGKVRGLLCMNCNLVIGHAKDDPERLRALAVYLEQSVASVT